MRLGHGFAIFLPIIKEEPFWEGFIFHFPGFQVTSKLCDPQEQ